jgi:hypothetical protein
MDFERRWAMSKYALVTPDGTAREVGGEVVPELSSHAGRIPAGTIVRLAVRLAGRNDWVAQAEAVLMWTGRALDPNGVVHKFPTRLRLRIPDHSADKPA